MNRLITPELKKNFASYPLYSQDGKKKDATCVCLFQLGNIRWYILEGQQEDDDFMLYGIVVGMAETEYGYISSNELADICVQGWRVTWNPNLPPIPLSEIKDAELQSFLSRLYDSDKPENA